MLPERLLRIAGHLPPMPPSVQEEHEVIQSLRRISATDRDAVIRMVRGLTSGASPPKENPPVLTERSSSVPSQTRIANDNLDQLMHEPDPDNPYSCAFSALAALLPTDALMELAIKLAQEAREYESENCDAAPVGRESTPAIAP